MKKLVVLIVTFLFINYNVEASTLAFSATNMQCTFINNTTQIKCDVSIPNFKEVITSISSNYTADNLTLKEIIIPNGWINVNINDNSFSLENTSSESKNNANIITLTFEVTNIVNSYSISLNDFKYISNDIEYNPLISYNILTRKNQNSPEVPAEERVTIGVTIKVKYTSSPFTTTTYAILKDNTLESLEIQKHKINFIKSLNVYNISIPKEEDSIDITYQLTNKNHSVAVEGDKNLSIGKNIVNIIIIDDEGDKNIYTINVYRGSELLNNDASLKSLTINNYTLDFNDKKYNYTLSIRNPKLNISAECNSETTTYQIFGNENIVDGSVITVKTIAQDNTSLEYKILIHYDLDIISPYIVYSSLSIIFSLSIYIIYKWQKECKTNKKIENLYKYK